MEIIFKSFKKGHERGTKKENKNMSQINRQGPSVSLTMRLE